MLDLVELFKKNPFVYYVRDDYYAFGNGVCKRINDEHGKFGILPLKYNAFVKALEEKELSQREAWDTYRAVSCIAEMDRDDYGHMDPENEFETLGFIEEEKEEIQDQLERWTMFFVNHRLVDFKGC